MAISRDTSSPAPRTGPRVRLDVTRFVNLLTLAAFASLFLPRAAWAVTDPSWLPAFLVLTVISVVLEFVAVELPHGGVVSVATIGHIATILLVPSPSSQAPGTMKFDVSIRLAKKNDRWWIVSVDEAP